MLSEHATEWLGYPVENFDPEGGTPDYRNKVYRIASEYDGDPLTDLLGRFLDGPGSQENPAIILGMFGGDDMQADSGPVVEALVAVRDRLPKLRGIFLGDIISEECEISWINQSNVSPLFRAYPNLEHFRVRGTNGLELGEIHHAKLKSLVIESGGLDVGVLREAVVEDLPGLEHLEIWLGSDNYGGNITLSDLEPVLSGKRFPKLKYLGLRDSEFQDEIAAAIARAPILARLETLDLSLGTLSDEGAAVGAGTRDDVQLQLRLDAAQAPRTNLRQPRRRFVTREEQRGRTFAGSRRRQQAERFEVTGRAHQRRPQRSRSTRRRSSTSVLGWSGPRKKSAPAIRPSLAQRADQASVSTRLNSTEAPRNFRCSRPRSSRNVRLPSGHRATFSR